MKRNSFLVGIQLVVFLAFIIISLSMVFASGVCCADDSFHAHIAKNFVDGFGYSSTVTPSRPQFSLVLFEPELGTGPTIILPAALIIKLVGNTYWAPGLAIVIVWGVLLLGIGIILNRIVSSKLELTIAVITFFVFAYFFTAYHFEHWYSLFGETPASLLIVLAILVYYSGVSRGNLILSGLLFSLGVQSKLVVFLPFVMFVGWISLEWLIKNRYQRRQEFKNLFISLVWVAVGFIIPIFLFELWKLFTLQPRSYLNYYLNYFPYMLNLGMEVKSSLITKLIERLGIAQERYGLSIPAILSYLAGTAFALKNDRKWAPVYTALALIICSFTFYWLLFSIGWARYYFIAVILLVFAIIIPFFSSSLKPVTKVLYTFILICLLLFNIHNINFSYPFRNLQPFKPSSSTLALQDVSRYLTSHIDQRPFLTQWWASAVDVEYLMDTHLNFTTYSDPAVDLNRRFLIVINQKFLLPADDKLRTLTEHCITREIDRYLVAECDPLISPELTDK